MIGFANAEGGLIAGSLKPPSGSCGTRASSTAPGPASASLTTSASIEGAIPAQLTQARFAIPERMPTRRALATTGRFERVGLVPEDAWLEGLVNAVIHRAYGLSGLSTTATRSPDETGSDPQGFCPVVAPGGPEMVDGSACYLAADGP